MGGENLHIPWLDAKSTKGQHYALNVQLISPAIGSGLAPSKCLINIYFMSNESRTLGCSIKQDLRGKSGWGSIYRQGDQKTSIIKVSTWSNRGLNCRGKATERKGDLKKLVSGCFTVMGSKRVGAIKDYQTDRETGDAIAALTETVKVQ